MKFSLKTLFGAALALWPLAPVQAQKPTQQLRIEAVVPGLFAFTTWKEIDGVLFPANGLYAVGEAGVAIVDAPWDTTQTRPLLDSIRVRHGKPVVLAIATHFHDDRTGSFPVLDRLGIATWSSRQTQALSRKHGDPVARFAFAGDTAFQLGSLRLEVYYPGGGHTPDNLVVWFPAQKVLFGGCLVKSVEAAGMGNVADAVVKEWPMAIENLRLRYPDRAVVIPGHQSWRGDPLAHTLALLKRNWKSLNKK